MGLVSHVFRYTRVPTNPSCFCLKKSLIFAQGKVMQEPARELHTQLGYIKYPFIHRSNSHVFFCTASVVTHLLLNILATWTLLDQLPRAVVLKKST